MCWPCTKCFTFALPFHSHGNTIIISVLHTRKLWLERLSNLSKVTQLHVTDRIQIQIAPFLKSVLFATSWTLKAIAKALFSEVIFHNLLPTSQEIVTFMPLTGHLSTEWRKLGDEFQGWEAYWFPWPTYIFFAKKKAKWLWVLNK